MSVDPQARAFLDEAADAGGSPPWETSIVQFRADFEAFIGAVGIPAQPVSRVRNDAIDGPHGPIPIRIYWPRTTPTDSDPASQLPVLLHFHGSGFIVGGLESHDAICRTLCLQADCIVVAVDYRKAPENRFPTAIDDCWVATNWTFDHLEELGGDRDRVAVLGDSTGGNNAAVMAQRAATSDSVAFCLQVLIYPPLDMAANTKSYDTYAEGYNLTAPVMRWFIDQYLNSEEDKRNPEASPLLTDDLSSLPPLYMLTAGFDPLRDEELQYINRVRSAGIQVEHSDFQDMFHGFWFMGGRIDAARRAHTDVAKSLREAFGNA